jgi:hypothetical protein
LAVPEAEFFESFDSLGDAAAALELESDDPESLLAAGLVSLAGFFA